MNKAYRVRWALFCFWNNIYEINMLRIAVQSKGRLYDETMLLLEEAGIKLNRGKRILLLSAKGFPIEVLFLHNQLPMGLPTLVS